MMIVALMERQGYNIIESARVDSQGNITGDPDSIEYLRDIMKRNHITPDKIERLVKMISFSYWWCAVIEE